MSDINSDLITQEVDDEVRRERMRQLWGAYGKYLIGLAIGIVLLVGGREGYTAFVQSREEASSAAFEAASKAAASDTANAAQVWQGTLNGLDGGYKALARLRLAAAAAANGNTADAVAAYDEIAADGASDESLRSLAQLFAGMLIARDGQDLDDARARLSVVAISGEPWYYSALEQLALVDLMKGDKNVALQGFNQLVSDAQTPAGIRGRATQLKASLEAELGIDPLADTLTDTLANPLADADAPTGEE